jgi:mevalonate kinase
LRAVRVSAPGKLILAGEHAAVYGRPALVSALGACLVLDLDAGEDEGVLVDLPDLGHRCLLGFDELRCYAEEKREAWRAYASDPRPESFAVVRGRDVDHLVKVGLGEVLLRTGLPEPGVGWRLSLLSAIPVGAGFGSSAAVASAVTIAAFTACGHGLDPQELASVVLEVERRQHGMPSGVDSAVVLAGGVQWIRRCESGELELTPVEADDRLTTRLRVVDTGTPDSPTGEVVSAVRERHEREPAVVEGMLDGLEAGTRELRRALESGEGEAFAAALRSLHRGLVALGVVPPAVATLVERIEAAGGAAKISGAGASRGASAGGLLVYHRRPEQLTGWDFLPPGGLLEASLGVSGARLERAS